MQKLAINVGLTVAVFLVTGLAYRLLLPTASFDPDHWYHLRLAALTQNHGILHTLPQVQDLNWGQNFPDKEFLFHALAAAAYSVYGEAGVEALVPLLALAIYLVTTAIAARSLTWPRALLLVTSLLATSAYFDQRMAMLRPHLLAIFIFLCLLYGLVVESVVVVLVTSVLFILSYHAFYMPCLLLGCYALSTSYQQRPWLRLTLAGVLGLVAGTLVHPYFPDHVAMAWRHVQVAFSSDPIAMSLRGSEVRPLAMRAWLHQFGAQFLLATGATIGLVHLLRTNAKGATPSPLLSKAMLIIPALWVTLGLSALSPRAGEYAVPLAALAAASVAALTGPKRFWVGLIVVSALALQAPAALRLVANVKPERDPRPAAMERLLSKIPAANSDLGTGAKVFNCAWDHSPYIFYARPDLRFIDILDATLLYAANPPLFHNRLGLLSGAIPDAYPLIKSLFHADYAVCDRSSDLATAMVTSSDFELISSEVLRDVNYGLYALKPTRSAAQVRAFSVGFWPPAATPERRPTLAASLPETLAWTPLYLADGEPVLFMDLRLVWQEQHRRASAGPAPPALCSYVSVPRSEVERLAGSRQVTIGGGPQIDLYINGQRVYSSEQLFIKPRLRATKVMLPQALSASDRLEAVLCAPDAHSYFGFALALEA